MTGCTISVEGAEGIADAMTVMDVAFDPCFGEAWTASQCGAILAMPGACLFIARSDRPLGFALTRTVMDETELMLLGVLPEVRRKGVGVTLLKQTMSFAKISGSRSYFLEVRADNPAIALYQATGMEQVGIRRGYYNGKDGKTRDALSLRRSLSEICIA